MSATSTASAELGPVLISLVPVVVGGLIGLTGAIGGGLLNHWLRRSSEKATRKAEKCEELLAAIFAHKHWLHLMDGHRVFGSGAPPGESPIAKIRAICSLYFPEFKERVKELDVAADQYELWMFKAGQERLDSGKPSEETMQKGLEQYEPYLRVFRQLINELESHAEAVYR